MRAIIFAIAILLLTLATANAQAPQLPTPQVSGCDSLLKLAAPRVIKLNPDKETVIEAQVLNARCSASRVYLDIEGIRPDIYFALTPEFYSYVLPGQTVSFNLTFQPKNLSKAYTGIYWIRTNNKWFNSGEVNLTLAVPEGAVQEFRKPVGQKEDAGAEKLPLQINVTKDQWAAAALLLIIGLIGGIVFYYKKK